MRVLQAHLRHHHHTAASKVQVTGTVGLHDREGSGVHVWLALLIGAGVHAEVQREFRTRGVHYW